MPKQIPLQAKLIREPKCEGVFFHEGVSYCLSSLIRVKTAELPPCSVDCRHISKTKADISLSINWDTGTAYFRCNNPEYNPKSSRKSA